MSDSGKGHDVGFNSNMERALLIVVVVVVAAVVVVVTDECKFVQSNSTVSGRDWPIGYII